MDWGSFRWGNCGRWVRQSDYARPMLPGLCHHLPQNTNQFKLIFLKLLSHSLRFHVSRCNKNQDIKGVLIIFFSGAWSLEISDNLLHSIPSLAFTGLERSLWCLILRNNKFTRIPADSVSRLQKLNRLDLAGELLDSLWQFEWLWLDGDQIKRNERQSWVLSSDCRNYWGNIVWFVAPASHSLVYQADLDLLAANSGVFCVSLWHLHRRDISADIKHKPKAWQNLCLIPRGVRAKTLIAQFQSYIFFKSSPYCSHLCGRYKILDD